MDCSKEKIDWSLARLDLERNVIYLLDTANTIPFRVFPYGKKIYQEVRSLDGKLLEAGYLIEKTNGSNNVA